MMKPFTSLLLGLLVAFSSTVDAEYERRSPGDRDEATQALTASVDKAMPGHAGTALSKAQLKPLIDRIASRYGVELALVHAIVAAESAYQVQAVSRAGALGLMQVMPETAADYGVTDPQDLFDPKINVETGVRHLRRLLSKYDNDYGRVIMAYNAGEGVVDRTNNRVTYAETLNYTEAVIRFYRRNGGTQPTDDALRHVALLRRTTNRGEARRLMKGYLDPSLLSLKIQPTLSLDRLDPGLHRVGPESRPMFELRPNPSGTFPD
ncbi:lytic transglycosylase domain-containing protein [Thioalkalicoccus limnaeus]|uniref:Lytic transglycosylase domain-containing protein n=1 Tax=Thioalkalicoccus limnaeus TaxID=120681 RepID=A0ABV4B9R1_9GAMM